jgi:hypothetical protein
MKKDFSGWIANLSNGETVAEGSSEPGKPTPWRQLLKLLKEDNELKLTGLRLHKNGITVHALPPKQCDGYFHAYEIHRIMYRNVIRHLQGVGSIVDDQVFITWIEEDTENIYSDVRTLEESKIHTTLG